MDTEKRTTHNRTDTVTLIRRPSEKKNIIMVDEQFGRRLNFLEGSKRSSNYNNNKETETSSIVQAKNNPNPNAKQVEFNKRLRSEPKNISLWLEFIAFQDDIYGGTKSKLIERKVDILKRAIELNPRDLELVTLHLSLAEEIEDLPSLLQLWDFYLEEFSDFNKQDQHEKEKFWELSWTWLQFRLNMFLSFNFEQINQVFSSLFSSFKDSYEHSETLFKEYICFLQRAGYYERIAALCQATIELNIEFFNYEMVELDGYSEQWDSGVMIHVGEDVLQDDLENYQDPILFLPQNKDKDKFQKWLQVEKARQNHIWYPKYNTDEDEVDYERNIIFEDISAYICIVPKVKSLEFIKSVLESLATAFNILNYGGFNNPPVKPDISCSSKKFKNFPVWFWTILKQLIPFYLHSDDWKFIARSFLFMNCLYSEAETEVFAKDLLSRNRTSDHLFFAFGFYMKTIGNNSVMSQKVFDSLSKRGKFVQEIANTNFKPFPSNSTSFSVDHGELFQSPSPINELEIYDLVRRNPGNKELYMEILESIHENEPLSLEVFNLIEEQQLRLHTLLEEVE